MYIYIYIYICIYIYILTLLYVLCFEGWGRVEIKNRHMISGKHAEELYVDFVMPPKASQLHFRGFGGMHGTWDSFVNQASIALTAFRFQTNDREVKTCFLYNSLLIEVSTNL